MSSTIELLKHPGSFCTMTETSTSHKCVASDAALSPTTVLDHEAGYGWTQEGSDCAQRRVAHFTGYNPARLREEGWRGDPST